jgi:hypothetical protein
VDQLLRSVERSTKSHEITPTNGNPRRRSKAERRLFTHRKGYEVYNNSCIFNPEPLSLKAVNRLSDCPMILFDPGNLNSAFRINKIEFFNSIKQGTLNEDFG